MPKSPVLPALACRIVPPGLLSGTLEVNASATTFLLGNLLPSKKVADLLPSFWHPFGGQKKLHDLLPSFFEFWTPKSHQKDSKKSRSLFLSSNLVSNQKKTAKSRRGHFGWQKVVMVKRTTSAKSRGTCVHLKC